MYVLKFFNTFKMFSALTGISRRQFNREHPYCTVVSGICGDIANDDNIICDMLYSICKEYGYICDEYAFITTGNAHHALYDDIIIGNDVDELEKITRLNHNELWDAGFNLDDMDAFIVSTEPIERFTVGGILLDCMEDYCCGVCTVKYEGRHYYTLHHA